PLTTLQLPHPTTLFPYTTLFRSLPHGEADRGGGAEARQRRDAADAGAGRGGQRGEARGDLLQQLTVTRLRVLGAQVLDVGAGQRSEEHTSELQSRENLVCRLLLE